MRGLFGFDIFFQTPDQMCRKWQVAVFFAFALNHFQLLPVKIQILKTNIADLHTPKAAAVKQPDQNFMFQKLTARQHPPNLLFAQYHRKLFVSLDFRKAQVIIRQTFGFQQKTQPVNGMFKIRCGRGF